MIWLSSDSVLTMVSRNTLILPKLTGDFGRNQENSIKRNAINGVQSTFVTSNKDDLCLHLHSPLPHHSGKSI